MTPRRRKALRTYGGVRRAECGTLAEEEQQESRRVRHYCDVRCVLSFDHAASSLLPSDRDALHGHIMRARPAAPVAPRRPFLIIVDVGKEVAMGDATWRWPLYSLAGLAAARPRHGVLEGQAASGCCDLCV